MISSYRSERGETKERQTSARADAEGGEARRREGAEERSERSHSSVRASAKLKSPKASAEYLERRNDERREAEPTQAPAINEAPMDGTERRRGKERRNEAREAVKRGADDGRRKARTVKATPTTRRSV